MRIALILAVISKFTLLHSTIVLYALGPTVFLAGILDTISSIQNGNGIVSTDYAEKKGTPNNDTFGRLDDTISGKNSYKSTNKKDQNQQEESAGFWLTAVLQINRFFSLHHSKLTKNIGIFTVVIGLIAVVQTQRQLTASQTNFRTEIDIQTKSNSALLINDYLNELNASNFQDENMSSAEEEFIGAKTQFILNGISHSTLRAEVLTFMGNTKLGSFISASPRKKQSGDNNFEALVSIAGISFNDGIVRGDFPDGIFSHASFQKTKLDSINIKGAALHYTDFREATITGGDLRETHFLCSTLANAQVLQQLPSFSDWNIRMTDLRGLNFSKHVVAKSNKNSSAELLASILNKTDINSVLVDQGVYKLLTPKKQASTITSTLSAEEWFGNVTENTLCDKLEIASSKQSAAKTVSALDLN